MGVLSTRAAAHSLTSRDPLWYVTGGPQHVRSKSGEVVTQDTALSLATYFACVAGIAEDVAGLPASVVAAGDGYRRPLRDHPITRLLADAPNDEMSAFTFIETMQAWCDGWGNGYAEIQRTNGRTRVVAIWPIHPSRVAVKREEGSGRVFYRVRASDIGEKDRDLRPEDVFHLHGLGDGIEGKSVLAYRADSIGLALAAQGTAAAMFKNEFLQSLTFTPTAVLDETTSKALFSALREQFAGVKKAGGVLGTNVAGKFERMGINPDEAQALESRKFAVPDVCRWFRRSPSKVGFTEQAKGWATREDEQADDVQQCLLPRVLRWEAEIRRKLLGFDSGLGFKFYFQGLLRSSADKRAVYYQTRLNAGSITPNEIRALEDEAPATDENADALLVSTNLGRLSALKDEPDPVPDPFPSAPAVEPPEDDDEVEAPAPEALDRRALALVAIKSPVRYVAARVVGKEAAAVTKALSKPAGTPPEWATRFYDGQRAMAGEALAPLSETYAAVAGIDAATTSSAVAALVAGLWPDPVARSGEAYRTNEDVLASSLAEQVLAALAAVEG